MKRRCIEVELYRYHVFLCMSDRPRHRRRLASLGPASSTFAFRFPEAEGLWRVNPSLASLNAISQAESERALLRRNRRRRPWRLPLSHWRA
jgi:hypothetical protein